MGGSLFWVIETDVGDIRANDRPTVMDQLLEYLHPVLTPRKVRCGVQNRYCDIPPAVLDLASVFERPDRCLLLGSKTTEYFVGNRLPRLGEFQNFHELAHEIIMPRVNHHLLGFPGQQGRVFPFRGYS